MAKRGPSQSVDKLIKELTALDARRTEVVAAIQSAIAGLGARLSGKHGIPR